MEEQKLIHTEVVDIDDLIQDDHNFNKGTEEGAQLIERSFKDYGAGRSVFIDKNNRLVGGNKAQKGFKGAGFRKVVIVDSDADTLVAVRRKDVDLDSKEGRDMALLDNLTTQKNLAWDEVELQQVGANVEGFDVGDFGVSIDQLPGNPFDVKEPTGETTQTEQPQAEEDDFDPDAHYETKVKAGEVWQLGEHRLMCGDSTDADAVAKLMNGERADLVFTDPPYGMNLTPNYKSIHKNHQAKAVDYQPIIGDQDVFDARFIFDLFEETKEMFLWGADYFRHTIPLGGGWFVWDKTCGKHEGRIGNEFELCWSKQQHKKEIIRIQWAGFVGMEEEDGARVHPTQKPVRLAGWFLSKYSKEGDIVADIFGGSGSTMIACEQLGRKCRMIELDPHYCTIIIARWEHNTGQKAIKL